MIPTKVIRILSLLFFILLSLIISGCFMESKEIKIVKSGHFDNHPEKTVGEAIEGFMSSPQWESGTGIDGETKGKTLVNVKGKITFMEKEVTAALQFIVDTTKETFQLNAFELNGIPQNPFMTVALIEKMFENGEATPVAEAPPAKPEDPADITSEDQADEHALEQLSTDFETADQEINRLYREIRSNLSPKEKATLKQEQLAWIKKKANICGEQTAEKDQLLCLTRMTNERISELRDYPVK